MKSKVVKKSSFSYIILLCVIICVVIIGIIFTIALIPLETTSGPSTNSLLYATVVRDSHSLKEKLNYLLPQAQQVQSLTESDPPWDKEYWTPIDLLDVESDAMVILCKLNFKEHAKNPHLSPMFKDLVSISHCLGQNRKREKLSVLLQEIKDNPNAPSSRIVKPTGFVFHESRVGSTLVANFMASDPYAMVFSESSPMANAILHCESCTHEYQLQLFRDITTLMGRSPFHKYLFFKFQSITVTNMQIALEAFPETPWAFIFRQPVQTMMSHLDPQKNNQNNAPCMRSKRHPPPDVQDAISKHVTGWPTNEAWCAAHLNMLCSFALRSYEKYGTRLDPSSNEFVQRGLLINYDSLPGSFPKMLLPLFGISPIPNNWLLKIKQESEFYSKGRGGPAQFKGDSKDKDKRATAAIQKYADKILQPTYELLNKKAIEGLQNLSPLLYKTIMKEDSSVKDNTNFNWKDLNEIPQVIATTSTAAVLLPSSTTETVISPEAVAEVNSEDTTKGHSVVLIEQEFKHWLPFANHHSSKPFHPARCPLLPDPHYPEAFSMIDITNNWNTDNTDIPPYHYDSICHFDYKNETQLKQSYAYRDAEKPYIVYNIPEVDEIVKKWNDLDYLNKKLGNKKYRTEISEDNHFMYWKNPRGGFLRTEKGKHWKEPTDIIETTFAKWIEFAVKNQNKTLENRDHQYFRVSSDQGNKWLYDELPFFQPKKSLMLVEPREQKGIHCRFGMRSIIAEAHFDGSRNSVVEIGGMRRWILTHPDECVNMHMLDKSHPSGRHSEVDWSKPDLKKFPNFAKLKGNEVILRPGDFLFVPTYWIHYIVSLNINMQCNSRSGVYHGYDQAIRKCGF